MYILGRPATYAAQILFGLFARNSALPTAHQVRGQTEDSLTHSTRGHDDETGTCSPNGIQGPLSTSTSRAPVPYTIPDTAITLNFTCFGFEIPVIQALSTIYEAQQQVQSHLASDAAKATNRNFEYHKHLTPQDTRVYSVVVQASAGLGLSWVQLDQILRGLTQFSSGAGVDRQVHYQQLQFEVSSSDKGRLGYGFFKCDSIHNRGATGSPVKFPKLDKRLTLLSGPVNETSLDSPVESNVLSIPLTGVSFPVLGTDITLAFVWLGYPLPKEKVNFALHGAFLKIAPFLKQSPNEPIPRDYFVQASISGKYQIAIQIYASIHMSWSQVNSVMVGLWRFTNGIGTVHERQYFRNLDFNVKDGKGMTIGYGNLLDITSTIGAATQKRSTLPAAQTLKSSSIHLVHPTNALSNPAPPYVWPIHGAPFTLVFTYMGDTLPDGEVYDAIGHALDRIKAAIRIIPDRSIPDAGFESHAGGVQVSVMAYEGAKISWWQLGVVLKGLEEFCTEYYRRLFLFDIEVEQFGRIGTGRLWHYDGDGSGGG